MCVWCGVLECVCGVVCLNVCVVWCVCVGFGVCNVLVSAHKTLRCVCGVSRVCRFWCVHGVWCVGVFFNVCLCVCVNTVCVCVFLCVCVLCVSVF